MPVLFDTHFHARDHRHRIKPEVRVIRQLQAQVVERDRRIDSAAHRLLWVREVLKRQQVWDSAMAKTINDTILELAPDV